MQNEMTQTLILIVSGMFLALRQQEKYAMHHEMIQTLMLLVTRMLVALRRQENMRCMMK